MLRSGTSVIIESILDQSDATWVTWRLEQASLPAGAIIHSVDVSICGSGEGNFWEVYGPLGSEPEEYEVTLPGVDGCWLFEGAPGHDLTVVAGTLYDSRLTINQVVYLVTFAR